MTGLRSRRNEGQPPLRISERSSGQWRVLCLAGELDVASAARLSGRALAGAGGMPLVILDLREVTFVDSSGLAALLNIKRRIVRAGGRLRLACDQPAVLDLLALTRLNWDFEVFDSPRQALAA